MGKPPRWSEKQLKEFKKNISMGKAPIFHLIIKDRYKNKSEREYAGILEIKKRNGDIIDWKYEPYSVRLATNTHIKPDFIVTTANGQEVHEVKGFPRPAWNAKWKIFKEIYSKEFYRFLVCKKINGVWNIQ